jgi:hypothetical protein
MPVSSASDAPYPFERGYPAGDSSQRARDDADLERALTAYRFWYPSVSNEGIFNGNREGGLNDNESALAAAVGPSAVAFTANSDTPYGAGVLDVKDGPWVIELPPGPFIGLVDDHHQGWILDMGLPGPDAGKGGKHLILPPGYEVKAPAGYHVGASASYKVLFAIRALPLKGDAKAALKALMTIRIYPLANPAKLLKLVDASGQRMDSTCLRWEDNIQYWKVLHKIIDEEPLVPKYLPMYGLLSALGIEQGKPFEPDARTSRILERAARMGRDQMLVSAFDSNRPDRINWSDRRWEWVGLVPGSVQFETPGGIDLEARDRWFAQAIVTSPAMFRRTAGAGSLYWMSVKDKHGAFLDGGKNYRLVLPQPVPAKLFWSVTIYDTRTRSQVQTDQNKAALRSLFEFKDAPATSPAELYVGPTAPAGKENQWIKTSAGSGWFAYIRIYGPEQAAFDKSWKPGDFEQIAAG